MRRQLTYGLVGGLFFSCVPIALLALGAARRRCGVLSLRRAAHEIVADPGETAYVAAAITVAFAFFGYVLGREADRLEACSETDPLTRLYNARGLWKRLQAEVARSKRYGEPLALLFLDLDRLKSINDTYGHCGGDSALRRVADAIRAELRAIDIGGRWGGDEFAIVAPNTSERSALALGERVRSLAAHLASEWHGTASLGVATMDPANLRESFDVDGLIHAVDVALHEAKHRGGNRVVGRSTDQMLSALSGAACFRPVGDPQARTA
jgi:diguanylate cyclase (GGDEF)-like protein